MCLFQQIPRTHIARHIVVYSGGRNLIHMSRQNFQIRLPQKERVPVQLRYLKVNAPLIIVCSYLSYMVKGMRFAYAYQQVPVFVEVAVGSETA